MNFMCVNYPKEEAFPYVFEAFGSEDLQTYFYINIHLYLNVVVLLFVARSV